MADGANTDDESDYRPGMRATAELGILSPLREAGFSKQDIRDISKELGIFTWNKPSYACLASRIPYGEEITAEKLAMVEKAEQTLWIWALRKCAYAVTENWRVLKLRKTIFQKLRHNAKKFPLPLKTQAFCMLRLIWKVSAAAV